MRIIEIAELYSLIKKHYPFFDASVEKVKADYAYLRDFPLDAARQNIDHHILTETVTPGIAHIRGRLGDMIDRERSKEQAEAFNAQLVAWAQDNRPPPVDYWNNVRAKLRGDCI